MKPRLPLVLSRLAFFSLVSALLGLNACGSEPSAESAASELRVLEFSPKGRTEHTEPIVLRFSRPVGPRQDGSWWSIEPALKLRQEWQRPDQVALVPEEPFEPSTRYSFRINRAGLQPGVRFEGPDHFRFFTPLLEVTAVSGHFGAENEPKTLWIAFSQAVSAEALSRRVSASVGGVTAELQLESADTVSEVHRFDLKQPDGVPFGETISVAISPDLRPASGGEPLGKEVVRQLSPLAIRPLEWLELRSTWQGGPRLRLRFDGPVKAEALQNKLSLRPKLPWTAHTEGAYVDIEAPFEIGKRYAVALLPSVQAVDGRLLDMDIEREVVIEEPPANLQIEGEKGVIIAGGRIRAHAVGVKRVEVEVIKVYQENLAHLLPDLSQAGNLPLESLGKRVKAPPVDVSGKSSFELQLTDPAPARPGLCKVILVDADRPYVRSEAWVQLGPLALTAKLGPEHARVEVRDLKGGPVSGATVELRSAASHRLARQTTDARGLAEFKRNAGESEPAAFVTAHGRGSFAFLPLEGTQLRPSSPYRQGKKDPPGDYQAFVFPAMRRAKPGQALDVLVLIRGLGLEVPRQGMPYALCLSDIHGRCLITQRGEVWRDGGDLIRLALPEDAFGPMQLRVEIDGETAGSTPIEVGDGTELAESSLAEAPEKASSHLEPLRLDLSLDQKSYPVGAIATARLGVPTPGLLRVSLERGQVYWEEVRRVIPGEVILPIPITEAVRPNVFVVAQFNPEQGPTVQDVVPIRVGETSPLKVTLSAPPKVRSQEALPVSIQVEGQGGRGYVALFALSKALMDGEDAPDPSFFFSDPRAWTLVTHDAKAEDRGAARFDFRSDPEATPASRGAAPKSRILAVSRIAKLPQNGLLTLDLHLPDVQGPLRLVAIAYSGAKFGSAIADTELRDPIYLEAQLPERLRLGDRFMLPVKVHNNTPEPKSVNLKLHGDFGFQQHNLQVAAQSQASWRFQGVASQEGSMQAVLRAGEASWEQSAEVTLEGPQVVYGAPASASFKRSGDMPLPVGRVRPESARARLLAGTSPLYRWSAPQVAALQNPRDDVIAVSQRLLARWGLPDLTRPTTWTRIGWPSWNRRLQAEASALLRFITPSGEVLAWPEGPPADLGSRAFLLHVLIEAQKDGLRLEPMLMKKALLMLKAKNKPSESFQSRAYAAFVLARAGQKEIPLVTGLAAGMPKDAPPEVRAWLGGALLLHNLPSGGELMMEAAKAESPTAVAEVLWVYTLVRPHDPMVETLADRLTDAAKYGNWAGGRTQAVALAAFRRIDAKVKKRRPYWGGMRKGGSVIRRFNSQKPLIYGDFKADFLDQPFSFSVTGAGEVFGGAVLEGRPKQALSQEATLSQVIAQEDDGIWRLSYRLSAAVSDRYVLTAPLPAGFVLTEAQVTDGKLARQSEAKGVFKTVLELSADRPVTIHLLGRMRFDGEFLWPGAELTDWSGFGRRALSVGRPVKVHVLNP